MKNFLVLLALTLTLSISVEAKSGLLYRVQVGNYKRADAPKDIRKVPKLKKYLLPSGYYCFFSGGYFLYFEGANRALAIVKEMGYTEAIIRVFKDEKIIAKEDAEKYILLETYNPTPIPSDQKVDKQIYSLSQKRTLENRIVIYKEALVPKPIVVIEKKDSLLIKKPKLNFISLIWKKKDKEEDGKIENIEELSAINNEEDTDTMEIDPELLAAIKDAVVEEKAEEIIDENDDELVLPDNFKVDDIPFFKIYLASTEKDRPVPVSVEYVPDIVYTYKKKDMTLYTVGYFHTSNEAQADLQRYVDKGFYNAKIIAIYKTIVVSQRMGDEILSRVKN